MASDRSTFFNTDEFAETITYTPSGGDAVSITALPEEIDPSIMAVASPADNMILHVLTADVSNPQRGDAFTVFSETWYLVENLGGGPHEGMWKILVSRSDKRRIG